MNQNDVTGGVTQPQADRTSLAHINAIGVHTNAGIATPDGGANRLARSVARTIVRNDDFRFETTEVDSEDAFDDRTDRLFFVVNRNDDGKLHGYDGLR